MRAFSEMLRRDIFFNRTSLFAQAEFRDALLSQHRAIGEAVVGADPEAAEKAIYEHLKFTGETVARTHRDAARVDLAVRRLNRSTLLSG